MNVMETKQEVWTFWVAISLLLSAQVVSARLADSLTEALEYVFGRGEPDILVVQLIFAFLLFALIYLSAEKIFPERQGPATVISIAIALITVRFLPEEVLRNLASFTSVFGVIIIVLFLFFL